MSDGLSGDETFKQQPFRVCSKRAGRERPLILTFTGTTGVGKTETARLIARALLGPSSSEPWPYGSRVILGSDYSTAEVAATPGGVAELRARLAGEVAQLLYECHGQAVVVFDEAQQADHGVIDGIQITNYRIMSRNTWVCDVAFIPLKDTEGAAFTHRDTDKDGHASVKPQVASQYRHATSYFLIVPLQVVSAAGLILIVISDLGSEDAQDFLTDVTLRAVEAARHSSSGDTDSSDSSSSSKLDPAAFQTAFDAAFASHWPSLAHSLRAKLSEEWVNPAGKTGFDLGSHSHAVVPFLPFNQRGVEAVLDRYLRGWARQHSDYWHRLVIDPQVARSLADVRYTEYQYEPELKEAAPELFAALKASRQATGYGHAPAAAIPVFGARGIIDHQDSPFRRFVETVVRHSGQRMKGDAFVEGESGVKQEAHEHGESNLCLFGPLVLTAAFFGSQRCGLASASLTTPTTFPPSTRSIE